VKDRVPIKGVSGGSLAHYSVGFVSNFTFLLNNSYLFDILTFGA
jgi:hypothetical protein